MPPQQQWQTGPMGGPAPSGPLPSAPGYPAASGPLPQGQPGYYQPMVVVQQQDNSTLAIVLEVVIGLFGLYGIGWLVAGFKDTGVKILVGGLIWWLVAIVISVFTLGIGLLCIWPIDLVIMIVSVVNLSKRLKERQMGIVR